MVPVSGGTFFMGCRDGRDTECNTNEKPAHNVTVHDFAIGRYEITRADWHTVMGNDPSKFKNCDQCPVTNVSWDDVQDFIKKANAKNGKKYRLPTEAEWEYAARGGNLSNNLLYAGANNMSEVGWFWKNSGDSLLSGEWGREKVHFNKCKTHPVGQKRRNELGLCDMSGNVWEWVADDWHGNYKNAPTDGSAWIGQGTRGDYRIVRGGSWSDLPRNCRAGVRTRNSPTIRNNNVGFRLSLSSQ